MDILFTASEGVPFCKTGGLADVIGSLPSALRREKINAAVIMPLYHDIPLQYRDKMTLKAELEVPLGWRRQYCGLKYLEYRGVPCYFVDNEYYFKRKGLYGFFDDAERFAYFNRAVLECLPRLAVKPQVLHCHDWHTGMTPVFLQAFYQEDDYYKDLKTIFTIHNLKYQGVFSEYILGDILGLDRKYFTVDGLEFYGDVSFMKGGIVYSDIITTVSKAYAEEIRNPYYGYRLDPLLRKRQGDLYGIVNGIDYREYNPLVDKAICVNYRTSLDKRAQNKIWLQEDLGLTPRGDVPLLGMVSRLVQEKGLDLLDHVLEEIMEMDLQVVVVGTGEKKYEKIFKDMAGRYPEKLAAVLAFDDTMARRVYAASDVLLMPSRYEPCGISQLIAMRYGAIPLVRETGGLKDTVQPYNQFTGEGNGFSFRNYNAHELLYTIQKAVAIFKKKEVWEEIVHNAMKSDFSWKRSAREYIDLYLKLLM